MNTDTGQVYWTAEAVEAARKRGEPLIDLQPIRPVTSPQKALDDLIKRMEALPKVERARISYKPKEETT